MKHFGVIWRYFGKKNPGWYLSRNCFKPTPASLLTVSVPRLANALRAQDPTLDFLESRRQAKEVQAVANEATDEERQAFINDSRN